MSADILPAGPVAAAAAHPVWTVVVVGVAFAALMLIDALMAVITGRGLYDRLRDGVATVVSYVPRPQSAMAAAPAAGAA